MAKLPYMPFYPADYLLDTQPLSPATRGLWMDMICHLWRAPKRGTMTLSPVQWLKLLRVPPGQFARTCNELALNDICDIVTNSNESVTVSSRRMLREEKVRESTRLRVQRHRVTHPCNAPVPISNRENQNQSHISESEVISQKSELREEKKEKKEKSSVPVKPARLASSVGTWEAYAAAYRTRYGVEPVRNATTNSQLSALVKRLGETEAPSVAAFYLTHNGAFYVQTRHPTNLLLKDAEGLRTQWATGVKATTLEAKSVEQKDSAREQVQRVRTMLGGA